MKSKSERQSRLKCAWINKFSPVPDGIQATTVIRGPFRNTILMETISFIEVHPKPRKAHKRVTLKTGIPDSWSEYVLYKYLQSCQTSKTEKNDTIVALQLKQLLETTEDLVERHHLPFLQGIPDPWKSWPSYSNVECSSQDPVD